MEDAVLKNGKYISFITLVDARGDEYTLPTVSFDMKDGKMQGAVAGESRNMIAL